MQSSIKKQLFLATIINTFILVFIAQKYLSFLNDGGYIFAKIYYVIATISHFMLLSMIPLLISLLVYFITKKRLLTKTVFVSFSTILIIILKIDTLVFSQFRFHISPFVLKMVFGKNAGDIFQFSISNYVSVILQILLIVFLQIFILFLTQKKSKKTSKVYAKPILTILAIMVFYSHAIFVWADASFYRPIMQSEEIYPLFFPLTAKTLMVDLGIVDKEIVDKNKNLYKLKEGALINYPLKPIKRKPIANKKNILFLIVDSWRFDCLTKKITPNLHKLSLKSQNFKNHHSGSNATSDGIFTLFYGLSGLNNDQFTEHEIPPLLMEELKFANYQFNIFSSATLENPPFDKNVFLNVPNLRLNTNGETPSQRDQAILDEWILTKNSTSSNPFFDFLFFDSPHGYDYPKSYKKVFTPSLEHVDYLNLDESTEVEPFYNKYKNSLNYVDFLAGKVISILENQNLLENTIVVVTGDHGQEFNDNKKGYWNHGGNYSKYQTQVPFFIYDSSLKPTTFNHLTLHYDVTPTLLNNYLGVENEINEISIGQNLYNTRQRDWFICGYKNTYALIEPNRITKIHKSSGTYSITDKELNYLDNSDINYEYFKKALESINKFYKK